MQVAAAAVQASARAVQASAGEVGAAGEKLPRSISVEGEVFGFTNWKAAAVTAAVSAVVGALLLLAGQSSKVSKADYEQLQAQNATLGKTNEQLGATVVRYEEQIKRYRGKNPKANGFPAQ